MFQWSPLQWVNGGPGPSDLQVLRGLKLGDLGLFILEKSRLKGDLISADQQIKDGRQENGARLFSGAQPQDKEQWT